MGAEAKATSPIQTVKPIWDGLCDEDKDGPFLVAGRCGECRGAALGVREICPHCHALGSLREDKIGRIGTLYSATVIHQAPAGFETPYRVGYVDVEDGVRVFAHIDNGKDAPRLGEKVKLAISHLKTDADGTPLTGPFYLRADGGQP